MNNEEKILQMLDLLVSEVGGIKSDIGELKDGQTALDTRMDGLEKGQDILASQVEP